MMNDIEGYGFFYESEDGSLYVACLRGIELYWAKFGPDVVVANIICFWEPSIASLRRLFDWTTAEKLNPGALDKLQHSHPLKIVKNIENTICSII